MAFFQMASDTNPLSHSPNFILPENHRPHLSQVSTLDSIPIIDLNDHDTNNLVQKLSQASEAYGFFQIINHEVPEELCNRMMTASTQFFKLAPEEKAQYFTTEHTKQEIGTLMIGYWDCYPKGLGLEKDCLRKKLGENPTLKAQAKLLSTVS